MVLLARTAGDPTGAGRPVRRAHRGARPRSPPGRREPRSTNATPSRSPGRGSTPRARRLRRWRRCCSRRSASTASWPSAWCSGPASWASAWRSARAARLLRAWSIRQGMRAGARRDGARAWWGRWPATRLLRGLLFGVGASDPATPGAGDRLSRRGGARGDVPARAPGLPVGSHDRPEDRLMLHTLLHEPPLRRPLAAQGAHALGLRDPHAGALHRGDDRDLQRGLHACCSARCPSPIPQGILLVRTYLAGSCELLLGGQLGRRGAAADQLRVLRPRVRRELQPRRARRLRRTWTARASAPTTSRCWACRPALGRGFRAEEASPGPRQCGAC